MARRFGILMVLVFMCAATGIEAQWSDDPAANLALADRSGSQVQAKIVARTDGGFFVSWFDNSTGGYDVYLQRLDASGVELWPHDGILVADRGYSSTQDYGLGIDTAGNALLAFRDDSSGSDEVTANRIGPDGTLLWGSAGVQVPSDLGFMAAPKVVGTSDGNIVVAWTLDSTTKVQKFDTSGVPMWAGQGVAFTPAVGSYWVSDLQSSDDGNVIVAFTHPTGGFGSPIYLSAQKLASADGSSLWAADHVKVFDDVPGSLQFGNFPGFVGDGAGGAVFSWYTSSPSLQCRVQRVLAGGNEAFAHQGVEVSTNGARLRVGPSAAFDSSSQSVYVFWTEENSGQSQWGVYGQKLNAAGVRQWTDSGLEVVPLGSSQTSGVSTLSTGTGAMVAWSESITFGNDPINGTFVKSDGTLPWAPAVVALKTTASATDDIVGTLGGGGFGVFAWTDGDFGDSDILAQNLNVDGTLGPNGGLFADGFELGDTTGWSLTQP